MGRSNSSQFSRRPDNSCQFGAPKSLLSDNGGAFISQVMEELAKLFGVKKIFTTPYHLQTNGQTERFNRTIMEIISAYIKGVGENKWDEYVTAAIMAYNSSIHSSTKETPAQMMLGRELQGPVDFTVMIDDEVLIREFKTDLIKGMATTHAEALKVADAVRQDSIERRRGKYKNHKFKIGNKVYIHRPKGKDESKKFFNRWIGPLTILDFDESGNTVKLRHEETGKILKNRQNVARLKKYYDVDPFFEKEEPQSDTIRVMGEKEILIFEDNTVLEDEQEYIVESIREWKYDPDRMIDTFLVRWKGFSSTQDTWEPITNMANSKQIIAAFLEQISCVCGNRASTIAMSRQHKSSCKTFQNKEKKRKETEELEKNKRRDQNKRNSKKIANQKNKNKNKN